MGRKRSVGSEVLGVYPVLIQRKKSGKREKRKRQKGREMERSHACPFLPAGPSWEVAKTVEFKVHFGILDWTFKLLK